jgi:hypothetical protein
MAGLQGSFWIVLCIVVGLSAIAAIVALLSSGRQWEEFGRDRLVMERETLSPHGPVLGSPAAMRERDDEIREFLEARNERRRRRGEAPIDVEAELQRLTAPHIDEGLAAEIRDLVIARNHRRARAGKPHLDVEAEVAREIEELTKLA